MDEQAYILSMIYNPAHSSSSESTLSMDKNGKDDFHEDDKREGKCCGISNRGWTLCISFLEIVVSLAGMTYIVMGILNHPRYNSHIFLFDEMVFEARKHLPNSVEKMPETQLFVNFVIFLSELLLAILLMTGVLKKSVTQVQFWLSIMLVYTLVTTGIVLGFFIGGIHSNYLNFLAFIHAFYRFSEIGIIYSYYEVLRLEKREKRILLANNNLDAVENAEAPPEYQQAVDDNNYPPPRPRPLGDSSMIGIATMPFI